MVLRNHNLAKLKAGYLFPEINARKRKFLQTNPQAQLISLGIGDTTKPIPPYITTSLQEAAFDLGNEKGYTGYGPEQGIEPLREKIASILYKNLIQSDEVFVSDGAKCDIARLQVLFGPSVSIAVQDPAYPVYVDGSIIQGVDQIVYMPCLPENNFFPDLTQLPRTDIIYFCSPNNPTGAVASKEQLQSLVAFAKQNHSIIIYDAAYSLFIQDPDLPKSIYEIDGAHEVAIETNSFSKMAGFTGVRLGWTVVPHALKYQDGHSVRSDWNRITTTLFNGASNIAQKGGLSILDGQGIQEINEMTHYYLENAHIIKNTIEELKFEVHGGVNAPYLWVNFKKNSWEQFQDLLEKAHLITTPGSGFGSAGEGFLRFSAFGKREDVKEACLRLKKLY